MMMMLSCHFAIWCILMKSMVAAGDDFLKGWRMKDRFVGFRFEISPFPDLILEKDVKVAIRDFADEHFCFGWIQNSLRKSIVGEARCTKESANSLKKFMSEILNEDQNHTISIREYRDTLIRLHFTHFKILSPRRNTCFGEEPHKCAHFYNEGSDGIQFRDR
mmetsp:Transcript_21494/g.45495  ORF Transcript_21494/g.45495 Transcript_21494/m.45495 type:complete len:162 (-) Transcript_21494:461-946(-)